MLDLLYTYFIRARGSFLLKI